MNNKVIYSMLLAIAILAVASVYLDYQAVYNNLGFAIDGKRLSYALFTEIAALIPIAILFMELDINKVWILIVALVMVATLYAEIAVKIDGVALGTYVFKLMGL